MGRIRSWLEWSIKNWFVFTAPAILLVIFAAGGHLMPILADAPDNLTVQDESLNETEIEVLVHERVNEVRGNHSRPLIRHDATLRTIASRYSEQMATEGFFAHESPNGQTLEDRYTAAGYDCSVQTEDGYVGGAENIYYTYAFTSVTTENGSAYYETESEIATAVVEGWMDSKPHRNLLLADYWRSEGIGVYVTEKSDGDGRVVYVTQNFC
jgi:uncharacterized protein YkwD